MSLALLVLSALAFSPQEGLSLQPADGDLLPEMLAQIDAAELRDHVDTLVEFHTRNTFSTVDSETQGIGAARRWLEADLQRTSEESDGRLQVRTQTFEATMRSRSGRRTAEFVNVLGFLPGRIGDEKGRTYIVSGHYDSIINDPFDPDAFAPGADDDASGTAVVLELARVMSKYEFDANLIFCCAAGEEQGLFGAKHLSAWAEENGIDVDGMITNDIVGGIEGGNGVVDEHTLRIFSGGEGLHDPSRELARRVWECSRKYATDSEVQLIFRLDRFGRGGDHIPFHERGVPAVRFTEANENYARQHKKVAEIGGQQYGDLPEYVSEAYMMRVARTNAAILGELALAPAPPSNVRLRAAMQYDTTVSWDPSPSDADRVAGYVVVWRETTSPVWQHQSELIEGTRTKIEGVIADNHFFGLRAVGKNDHMSRTAIPARP